MASDRSSTGTRVSALFALIAVAFVLFGSTVGLAANPGSGAESCVGCAGCERGECEDENPLESHHHCCLKSCMSHTFCAMPSPSPSPDPVMDAPMRAVDSVLFIGRTPDTPYRPPRS